MRKIQRLFGIAIDAIRMPEAIAQLHDWIREPNAGCRYVVTPNVDHAVMLQENDSLRDAYQDASMVLADGHPLIWASRLLRCPIPERVPGSDLVPRFFQSCDGRDKPIRVFLLGAAPGVGLRAAENIHLRWHGIQIVGIYSPPMGFEKSADENEIILGRIALARPDVLVIGLGAPKQELWVRKHREQIRARVALCVGATIDFLAGHKRRAPGWMQRAGVEWVHRMLSEPRRLVKRYARDAWVFPQLVFRQWLHADSFPNMTR
jgi:N-acetylglucosaminyldiphosphoundecaprenol N-acetyl-beta-D-mannosaminyltransferase